MKGLIVVAVVVALFSSFAAAYNVGVGIWDTTGPAVEIEFMGYALLGQRGTGILQRLRARAFVISSEEQRIAFVSVDGGMGSDLVKQRVVESLEVKFGPGVYTVDNVCISGTHTHSGPGGFLQYVLYQTTSLGFVRETFDAWVEGIVNSIVMAHENVQSGASISVSSGKLLNSNINRSPTSYLLNPAEERAQYEDGDTDKDMLLLKFSDQKGRVMGVLNWFAVHATSMNNTNTLVNGDNKGYASYLMEKALNGPESLPGMGPAVAAFASTNLGDVSPNTQGAKCVAGPQAGQPCDGTTSTCGGRCEDCIAFGPGKDGDMLQSTAIIGRQQFEFAQALLVDGPHTSTLLQGAVDSRHSFVTFPGLNVTRSGGQVSTLCAPAMGMSFAAGTTDGPGMFNFAQGDTKTLNPFWNRVRDFLEEPTEEEKRCQAPKPILLNTGLMEKPYSWDPSVLPLQILRVGQLFILAVPAEFTTMAGRRLRKAVGQAISATGVLPAGTQPIVTIAGLANGYSSYVTTEEEYAAQRYEAASTIFGPHTLEGYLQELARIAKDIGTGSPSASGPPPQDFSARQIDAMPGVVFDRVPTGAEFGQVIQDALPLYRPGDVATVTFHSANPRNNQRAQGSYLTVERQQEDGGFATVFTDGDWCTTFHWVAGKADKYAFGLSAVSVATIQWTVPADGSAQPGAYRVCHFGDHKQLLGGAIKPFSGCSATFQVAQAQA